MTHLFQHGDFTLASGAKSKWKIECDALTEDDWAGLAVMVKERVGPFSYVYGVPRGGVPFADALRAYASVGARHALVVDDVWTTGGSMRTFIEKDLGGFDTPPFKAVVFARNPTPDDVLALFTMPTVDLR